MSNLQSLPYDIIANISQYLDLVSTTALMDTCQHFRYLYLSSENIWRRIHFELNQNIDLHKTYSSLRKLGDSNGLNQLVRQVTMDGCDDAHFSPIIMLIKFPNLRILSASHRPENTNLEVDIKLLQEMIKSKAIQTNSLKLEKLSIFHHQMDFETHFITFQRLWNKLSLNNVELDIDQCNYDHVTDQDVLERLRLMELTNQMRGTPMEQNKCPRIIRLDACCWSCGHQFKHCWKCVPVCGGCKLKRIPPLANDNQIKLKNRRHQELKSQVDEDEFSVFN